ncbi:Zinc finger transcription factor [Pseudozyma hubeiensis]|nr:Zinc finger transcription factor [Pseudozyma hubeiensis]
MASDSNTKNHVQIEFADGGRMVLPESFRPGDPSFWAAVIADTVRAGKSSAPIRAGLMDRSSSRGPSASTMTSLALSAADSFSAASPHIDQTDEMASTVDTPFTVPSLHDDPRDTMVNAVPIKQEVPDSDPDYNFEEEVMDGEDQAESRDQAEAVGTSRIKLDGRPGLTVKLRRPQRTTDDAGSTGQQPHTYTSTRQLIVDRHGVECTSCRELDLECIDVPSPRGYRCVACQQLKTSCDWGDAWLRNHHIHQYLSCLRHGCSLEDADQEVYEYLGILGGPLDKVKTYSWMVQSAVPSGSRSQAL